MSAQASLSPSTTAPTGAEAAWTTPSNLLLLAIIRLLVAWGESVAASLRQRTVTATQADLMRSFGTTDTALILQRATIFVQRLRALEAMVRRSTTGLDTDPHLTSSIAPTSARRPSAPPRRGITPPHVDTLPTAPTLKRRTAAPVRATGPPRPRLSPSQSQRGRTILSHRGAWPAS